MLTLSEMGTYAILAVATIAVLGFAVGVDGGFKGFFVRPKHRFCDGTGRRGRVECRPCRGRGHVADRHYRKGVR